MQDQGSDRTSSSSSTSNSLNASNVRACSISAPSKPALDLLVSYLDDLLSAVIDKGPQSKRSDTGIKLKDIVQPIASDFSTFLERISQGANIFSDQKSSTPRLSSEVHTVALDVLKGLGKAHWVAFGLLVIANVLERFDKISSNDRECTDLLRGMLDLAKIVKQLKDINADFHIEILRKMEEAVHLIVRGAILCHSFITCSKISKFLLTTKIREELVYVRGKVDRIIRDLGIQMEFMILSSLNFHRSRQQQHNDNEGGTEETRYPSEEFSLQPCNLGGANIHSGEIEEICETQTHQMEMQSETCSTLPASNGQVEFGCYKKQLPAKDNSKNKNQNQLEVFLSRLIPRPARMLKTIVHGLHKITGHKVEGRERSVHSDLGITLDENQLSSFTIEHGFGRSLMRFAIQELETATNGFQCKLGEGGFGCVYKGILANGRQVVVKRARKETRELLLNELVSIASLDHPNILKLVGVCIAKKELMLVYDYMPHGTLSDILFDPIKKQVLDWRRRFDVIVGVISALAFLHEDADVRIVHRDVNPANIILDANFSAKISEFGLSRELQDTQDSPVRGTFGYIAPEYKETGDVTEKADIYSFGILVLNIVSGKGCLESASVDDGLHNPVEPELFQEENRLIDLIDPDLVKVPGFDSGDILRVIMIALLCIQIDPDLRPPTSQVLAMLSTKEVEIPRAPAQLPPEFNNVCSIPSSVFISPC